MRLVAFDLLALFELGEIGANVLRFDVSEPQTVLTARDLVIGGAALLPLGFIRRDNIRKGFEECLELGSISVFSRIVTLMRVFNRPEVISNGHPGTQNPFISLKMAAEIGRPHLAACGRPTEHADSS